MTTPTFLAARSKDIAEGRFGREFILFLMSWDLLQKGSA